MKKFKLTILCSFISLSFNCGKQANIPPTPVTPVDGRKFIFKDETLLVATADYVAGGQLLAIDPKSKSNTKIAGSELVGTDPLIRSFNNILYLVNRDAFGNKNNIITLNIEKDFEPTCNDKPENCQKKLPDKYNAQDLVPVAANKVYISSYSKSEILIFDPIEGKEIKTVSIIDSEVAKNNKINLIDTDNNFDISRMYLYNQYLFIEAQLLKDFNPMETAAGSNCPYVGGKIFVLDTRTDQIIKVISLQGSNPNSLSREPNTPYLLVATPGPMGQASQDNCHGIERINMDTLEHSGFFATEAQIGTENIEKNGRKTSGSVLGFAVGNNGNGIAFISVQDDQKYKFEYKVVRIARNIGRIGSDISAPGFDNFEEPSFVFSHDYVKGIVGLPFSLISNLKYNITGYDLETGSLSMDAIELTQKAKDVVHYKPL